MGDPAGVGPELIARALAADGDEGVTVWGDPGVLERAARARGVPPPARVVAVTALDGVVPGRPHPDGGAAQVAYLEAAVAAVRARTLDALVTAPIHKAACRRAGFAFPGHTEFLAERLGAERVAMMIAGPHLRVVPATTHVALAAVPRLLDEAQLAATIALTARALAADFGVARPRVAVCGLNPHAGEEGAFGDEEARLVRPAIERARSELGALAEVSGPHVPDAVFRAAAAPPVGEGRYDAVIGLYHDQALIPVKLVDFDEAVNVTLGLPVPRTSPDHGVAYDAAAAGCARDGSFRAALRLARELGARRRGAP
jgi:4-hydroxythreonine-4-phosphate dehydrogenase